MHPRNRNPPRPPSAAGQDSQSRHPIAAPDQRRSRVRTQGKQRLVDGQGRPDGTASWVAPTIADDVLTSLDNRQGAVPTVSAAEWAAAHAAFAEKWQHWARLVMFVRQRGLPSDVAHDIVQDAFLRLAVLVRAGTTEERVHRALSPLSLRSYATDAIRKRTRERLRDERAATHFSVIHGVLEREEKLR